MKETNGGSVQTVRAGIEWPLALFGLQCRLIEDLDVDDEKAYARVTQTPLMSNHSHLRWATAGSVLLALLGIGYAVLILSRIPADPPGDGFVAGLTAAFGLALLLTSLFALGEASVLALVTRLSNPSPLSHRLLLVGAVAGGLSVLPTLIIEIARNLQPGSPLAGAIIRLVAPMFGAWLILAATGLLCSGAGTILQGTTIVRGRLEDG